MNPSTSLVLALGSRALSAVDVAPWALERLREHLSADAVVVTDSEQGHSDLVAQAAKVAGCVCWRYGLDGLVRGPEASRDLIIRPWLRRVTPPSKGAHRALWAAWFQRRDRTMVRHIARRSATFGVEAKCLVLIAAWADRRESERLENIARHAEHMGLPTIRGVLHRPALAVANCAIEITR